MNARNGKQRRIGLIHFAFCILSSAFCILFASAGPVEDAQALLAQKKYDQIDAVLEKLLSQEKPPEAALRVALDAALATGRVVAAEKRIGALLQITQSPDLLYLGGEIADRAGDANLAGARFLTFARQTDQKSDTLSYALRYLLRKNTYPEEFKKYVTLFGADGTAWTLGCTQLERLLQAGEPEKACEVAALVIERFPAPALVSHIHRRLKTSADRLELGGADRERYLLPLLAMAKGKPEDYGELDQIFGQAARAMTPEEQVATTFAIQAIAKEPLRWGLFSRFGLIRNFAADEARLAEGRKLLALEPLYRDSKDLAHADGFLTILGDSPQVFNIQGKALVPPAAMQQRFEALLAGPLASSRHPAASPAAMAASLGTIRQQLRRVTSNYLGNNTPEAIAFLKKHITLIDTQQFAELLEAVKGEGFDALRAAAEPGRGYNEVLDLRTRCFKWYDAAKNGGQILAIAKDYLNAFPGNFDWGRIYHGVMASPNIDLDSKINLLQDIAARGGASGPMNALVNDLLKITDNAKKRIWADNPRFQAFKKDLDQKKPGSDPLLSAQVALYNQPNETRNVKAPTFEVARKLLAAYKGRVPGGWETTKNAQDALLYGIFDRHAGLHWDTRQGICEVAELWTPRLDLGSGWEAISRRLDEHQARPTLHNVAPHYTALVKAANAPGDPAVWYHLKNATNPRTDPKPLFSDVYARMGGELGLAYLLGQDAIEPQAMIDEMARIVAAPGFKFTDRGLANALIHALYQRTGPTSKPPVALINALWSFYLAEEDRTRSYSVLTETYAWGIYTKAGHAKEAAAFLPAYFAAVARRTVPQQIEAIACIFSSLPQEAEPKPADGVGLPQSARFHTLLKRLRPLYERLPRPDWPLAVIYDQVLDDSVAIAASWPAGADKVEAQKFLRLQVEMFLDGTRHSGRGTSLFAPLTLRIGEAIDAKDWDLLSRLTRSYAAVLRWEGDWNKNYQANILPIIERLEGIKAFELAYIFLQEVERRNRPPEEVAKQLAIVKARVAREIPGLIPVPKGSPAYDLHVAAQTLSFGDEAKAWELTAPRLKLLPTLWTTLDPAYVAWTVDQMRKQKLLKEALELAFTVLLREFDLDPEIAAAVSLAKGDIYADMQNYQAARIEYEGLKNNRRYNRTEAGAKAKYRLINLLILTKDYAAAEQLLQRLLDSDSLETQAEAHYLHARMAYDQADYELAKEHLKEVFKRKHDHVEARLLEGELKLLVPRGLASTEVLVGNPRLRTIAIPGRILTLKLQDANLSIARGGAAIPVVVTTAPGGDSELVKLLPSAGEKNLFTGTIATALGKVEKNNLQLELRGNDTVSYVIEPAFQKANDLTYPAKTLEVKYDGRLTASAGEILTEEEAEKRALELRMARERGQLDSRRFEGRSGQTVRPGSPIYVQVTDLDCDLTDAKDTVPVDLRTSSGDLLKGFKLTETGPHTGLFRGAVPTGIPFPKATASDSQEGKDPSVTINTAKNDVWVSLADGQKPKWLEVDTMSSHLVKSASLLCPEPKKIKGVALVGLLADDYTLLAAFPKGAHGFGQGLKGEYHQGTTFENLRLTRVDPKIDFDFSRRAPDRSLGGENLSVRWTGQIQPRYSETYTLYTISDDGVRLFVDGKKLIENWNDHAVVEDKANVDLKAGQKYDIKIEYYQGSGDAGMTLLWSSKSQKKEVVPESQLYPGAGAAELVKPRGEIAQTDTGFAATLAEPERLRKLKWIFEDFEGESVAVKKIAIKNAEDKDVVPVKEDFSTGTTNATLEISPGDRIEVAYVDERRTLKDTPNLTANLNSSYFNGSCLVANEVIEQREEQRWTTFQPAKRCRDGDQLMVVVTDYDEDLSDKRDTVPVQVATSSGEKLTLQALETWVNDATEERQGHSGVFLALLKIGKATEKDTIKISPGDTLTASYLDKENTNPGVPVERTYALEEAGSGKPRLVVYRTTVASVVDKSEEAKAKMRRMAMRGKRIEDMVIYRDEITARHPDYVEKSPVGTQQPAEKKEEKKEEKKPEAAPADAPIPVSVQAPLFFELAYPKMALNSGSIFHISAVAESELAAAAKANRKPNELKVPMYIKDIVTVARDKGYRITAQRPMVVLPDTAKAAPRADWLGAGPGTASWRGVGEVERMLDDGRFCGVIRLQIGSPGDAIDDLVVAGAKEFETATRRTEDDYSYRVATLLVAGSDVVHLQVKDAETGETATTKVRLLSNARLELLDMTYTAEKDAIHLGESFYVKVTDPDHDRSDQQDKIVVKVAAASGDKLDLELTETLPHAGVFTGSFKPEFLGEGAVLRPEAGGQKPEAGGQKPEAGGQGPEAGGQGPAASPLRPPASPAPKPGPQANLNDQVLSVAFGDEVTFTYTDDTSMLSKDPVDVAAKGRVHYGSDCELASFTKRFKDPEMAVKTRFLMAEALFEMAKEHRKLAQEDKANEEIGQGKRILEEALRDYPTTSLAAQGEFLLANLAQELDHNQEAIGRYSNIISNWPDSEYAPRSQFKKAICLEKMGNYDQACEEYVKVTYIYPDSSLVADATVRLGNYYYKEKAYKVAGKVFFKFQQRNPSHALACKALFLSAQCYMKMEDFKESVRLLSMLIDEYTDDKDVRAEAMYWLGDSYFKDHNYAKAYQTFKKLTWDYPESKWAKIARGRLTEDVLARFEEEGM